MWRAGSDIPVSAPDPLKGIYAAVTRRAENGQPVAAHQAVSTLEAIGLYTAGAAYYCWRKAWLLEKELGAIAKENGQTW
jgi:predicted amidohydrolase YtcJ